MLVRRVRAFICKNGVELHFLYVLRDPSLHMLSNDIQKLILYPGGGLGNLSRPTAICAGCE